MDPLFGGSQDPHGDHPLEKWNWC